jgi:hypothetical protein
MFIPKRSVLERMLARVTSKDNIFQHVKLDTTVQSVRFEEALGKFVIVTIDTVAREKHLSGITTSAFGLRAGTANRTLRPKLEICD